VEFLNKIGAEMPGSPKNLAKAAALASIVHVKQ
jgi:hypothetical protein